MFGSNSRKRILIIIAAGLVFLLCSFFTWSNIHNAKIYSNLPPLVNQWDENSRLLVFAPHSDDETIGAAFLIQEVLAARGTVKIVLFTNGEAFTYDSENTANNKLEAKDYISLGYKRQKETQTAMSLLGVKQEDIIFLGYPDGSLKRLWQNNWDEDNPYTSLTLGLPFSPYQNSYQDHPLFYGQNIAEALKEIIAQYRPNLIVLPHPKDNHPDHWAAGAFVKYTLAIMDYQADLELLYLVHQNSWPYRYFSKPIVPLLPPANLLSGGTDWYKLPAASSGIEQKKAALDEYKSQLDLIRRYLYSFVRKNELFGLYDDISLPDNALPDRLIKPSGENELIRNPAPTGLLRKSRDLRSLHGELSMEGNLHFFLVISNESANELSYQLNGVLISHGESRRFYLKLEGEQYSMNNMPLEAEMNIERNGSIIHITLPLQPFLKYDHLFLAAECYAGEDLRDKTNWRMITLPATSGSFAARE